MKTFALSMLLLSIAAPAWASPLGEWRTADGSATVQVRRCGRAICGSIGKAPVLNSMRPSGKNVWTGTISDVRSGSIYDGSVSLLGDNSLQVHGCLHASTMCGDQTWTRVK
jgi:uncharacterized protein (DUF2147 family)